MSHADTQKDRHFQTIVKLHLGHPKMRESTRQRKYILYVWKEEQF